MRTCVGYTIGDENFDGISSCKKSPHWDLGIIFNGTNRKFFEC